MRIPGEISMKKKNTARNFSTTSVLETFVYVNYDRFRRRTRMLKLKSDASQIHFDDRDVNKKLGVPEVFIPNHSIHQGCQPH